MLRMKPNLSPCGKKAAELVVTGLLVVSGVFCNRIFFQNAFGIWLTISFILVAGVVIFCGWTIICLWCAIREKKWALAIINLCVPIAVFAVMQTVEPVAQRLNYWWFHNKRQAVVRLIESGALQGRGDDVFLPDYLANTSATETVSVQRSQGTLKVSFPDYLGVTDSYTAYVYSSHGDVPQGKDFGGDVSGFKQLSKHWFYVAFS